MATIALDEPARLQDRGKIRIQPLIAADHHAVFIRVERGHTDIIGEGVLLDQIGNPPAIAEWLAGNGWIIDKLFAHVIAQKLVYRQFLLDHFGISEFGHFAGTVNEHDFLVMLIGFRIADQAEERG